MDDDRWKMKGGPMTTRKDIEPKVCKTCEGYGTLWYYDEQENHVYGDCPTCGGEGYII